MGYGMLNCQFIQQYNGLSYFECGQPATHQSGRLAYCTKHAKMLLEVSNGAVCITELGGSVALQAEAQRLPADEVENTL